MQRCLTVTSAQSWQKLGVQVHPSNVWGSLARSDLHGRAEPKRQTSDMETRPSSSSMHKHIGTGVQKNGNYLSVPEGSLLKGWRVVLEVMAWLPKTLDLNIIKYSWDYRKRQMDLRKPTSPEDLRLFLQNIWKNLPAEFLQKVCSVIPASQGVRWSHQILIWNRFLCWLFYTFCLVMKLNK